MKFGGWWLAKIEGLEGEREVFSIFANRTKLGIARGGKLFVTDRRLLFTPHLIDSMLGGATHEISLSEIVRVSKREAGGDIFGGGLRARLQIDLKNGATELFVVNKLDQIIEKLQSHINFGGIS